MSELQLQQQQRQQQLAIWASQSLGISPPTLTSVSGDASFRRYFRFQTVIEGKPCSIIAVDSPPATEKNTEFCAIRALFANHQLHVPDLIDCDMQQGFFLLSDLGDTLYLSQLTTQTAEALYQHAMQALLKIQQIPLNDVQLPAYNRELLAFELSLFNDWFLQKHLQLALTPYEKQMLAQTFEQLINNALNQTQVVVHRDYHSRNLMICAQQTPGIIDFQDAVTGPVTYDLVSLMKDCYIEWPEHQVKKWSENYCQQLHQAAISSQPFTDFYRDFEWMGMQRHIKVLGIFCRLNYRDNKPQYLNDLPLTFRYLINAANQYAEFSEFSAFLAQKIAPHIKMDN
ncbi:aminoglycoside phosphotransferase family protein [Aliikangiella maris]|uniref:Phosphotransferase n=2 Tax=Aliikangiella maris TaxID=3162458 RepID=A0ABV3MLK3_9GAMM